MSGHLLVTGAGGFIGRHVVTGALAAGHSVTAVVRPGSSYPGAGASPLLRIAHWDAGGGPPAAELFADVTAVCHLAAFYPPDMSASLHAEQCLRVNALGTLHLLEVLAGRGIHLVQISAGQFYKRSGRLAMETEAVFPASRAVYYLSSKLVAELYVGNFAERGAVPSTILRVGSVYGAGMHGGAVHRFVLNAHEKVPIEIPAASQYTVDLVYVGDVVQAVLSAVERRCHGTFNIGSGSATTLETLAQHALDSCNAPRTLLRRTDAAATDLGFDGLDITRARQQLGFTPTALADGLRATVRAMFPPLP